MSSYELLTRLPVFPISIVLIAAIIYGTFKIYMNNRDQKGLGGQILLYSLLAAFMVGERIGRLTSTFSAGETADREPVDQRPGR